jgi:hypothetical protein
LWVSHSSLKVSVGGAYHNFSIAGHAIVCANARAAAAVDNGGACGN